MNVNEGNKMNDAMQSESINELADALCKAQGEIEGATKDAVNPFHKSKYADLHSVIACAKEPLANNGLSVVQPTQIINGQLCLVTLLMHKSGQWIKGIVPLISDKQDPQSIGKIFTYYRRYAYSSLLNISQYDDDAEEAMKKERKEAKAQPPQPEVIEVGEKVYMMVDLENKILSEKRVIPDKAKLKAYIKEKADANNKTPAQIIASAMKSESQFNGFCTAFFSISPSHTASPSSAGEVETLPAHAP